MAITQIGWDDARALIEAAGMLVVDDETAVFVEAKHHDSGGELIFYDIRDNRRVTSVRQAKNPTVDAEGALLWMYTETYHTVQVAIYKTWVVGDEMLPPACSDVSSARPDGIAVAGMSADEFAATWETILPGIKEIAETVFPPPDGMVIPCVAWLHRLRDTHGVARTFCHREGLDMHRHLPGYMLEGCHSADDLVRLWERSARYRSVVGHDVIRAMADTAAQGTRLLRLVTPGWFEHEGFQSWLAHCNTATWHLPSQSDPPSYTDVFFTWCGGHTGSDAPYDGVEACIPELIWDELSFIVADVYGWDADVLVWLSRDLG
jgi:hypothetical protein